MAYLGIHRWVYYTLIKNNLVLTFPCIIKRTVRETLVGESTTIAAEFLSRVAIIIERSRLRSQEVKTKEV